MPIWTGAGADNNWSTVGNWDTGVPTATTTAIFNGVAPNGNKNCIITSGATCSDLNFTGYSGQVNFANGLTVRGSITLGTSMTFAGSNGFVLNNNGAVTHTSNGVAFDRPLTTNQNGSGGNVVTFVGNWQVSSFTLTSIGGNPFSFQGAGVITVNGNMSLGQPMTGSNMTFRIAATSTLNTFGGFGSFTGTLNLDSGANTISINNLLLGASTVNYVSGNIVHTGTLTVGSAVNLNLQNLQFNNYAQNFNTTCTLISDANFNNVTYGTVGGTGVNLIGVGRRLNCRGNFTFSQTTANGSGTATITLTGSGNINSTSGFAVLNDFEINTLGAYTFTSNGFFRSFKRINGTVNAGLFTVTFAAGAILDTAGITWYNVTIPGSIFVNFQLDSLLTVSETLLIQATTTFTGTRGFTCKNLTCSTAAAVITLQNINANPLAEYTVTGVLTLIGTLASRITLQAAGSASFNATINPVGQLNYLSGTVPSVGMTVSQSTGVSPAGLIGLLPNRPVITGGTSPTFTISPAATATIGASTAMRAGYKAKFTLANNGTSSQNVAYVTTQDIDSSAGVTITSFGSNGDNVNNSTISLFRTLNWGPLVAPSGSVYYTWVE